MHQQLAHVLQVHLSASAETTFLSVIQRPSVTAPCWSHFEAVLAYGDPVLSPSVEISILSLLSTLFHHVCMKAQRPEALFSSVAGFLAHQSGKT